MFVYCGNNPINMIDPTGYRKVAASSNTAPFFLTMALGTAFVVTARSHIDEKEQSGTISSSGSKTGADYTVYFLCAADDASSTIIYVGRVKSVNFKTRMEYHKSHGRELVNSISGLSYPACRAIEQGGMMYYHTINRNSSLNNQIRGISPRNDNRFLYLQSVFDMIATNTYPANSFLPASYWENLTEEAFLNLGP